MGLQKGIKTMVHFIWQVMRVRLFSLPLTKVGIHFGHVRMYATPYPVIWIILILDLGLSYTIPMGTNCAPLLADLFLYCYERDFMAGASCLLLGPTGSNWCFSFDPELVGYSASRDLHRRAAYSICESCFFYSSGCLS